MKKNAITYEEYAKAHPATQKKHNDPMFSDSDANKKQPEKTQPQKSTKTPAVKKTSPKHTVSGNPEIDHKVSTYLDQMKQMVDKAIASGGKTPNFDLCQISVPGTNLFCRGNKGIERKDMPQLKGIAAKGTKAENLPVGQDGEVSIEKSFVESLKQKGVKLTNKQVEASRLKSTQNQLVGSKVVGMIDALKKNPQDPNIAAPIFVSKDGYVLDGHHRWAAMVGLNFSSEKPVHMNIVEVDMGIDDLVEYTNNFADEMGIRQKAAKLRIIAQMIRAIQS